MLTTSPLAGLASVDAQGAVVDLVGFAQSNHTRFGTGWSIDDICGEIGVGEMALMWARSSGGKSTWTLNMIANTPEVPTLVINMEMTPRRQIEWLSSMTFHLPVPGRELETVLRRGPQDPHYGECIGLLEQMPERYPHLHFANPSRPTVSDIKVIMDDIEDATGVRPQRVFIDHLGLLAGAEEGYAGYAKNTANLHSLAMSQSIALIVLQQVGRGGAEGRNDGHRPVTFGDGLYTGEQDADWVYGLYRPDRDPQFKKGQHQFDDPNDYWEMRDRYLAVKGQVILQVIKNRPYSDVHEEGITLMFESYTRRYTEL